MEWPLIPGETMRPEDPLKEIEQDLTAFADPGTPVIVEQDSAVWIQDGAEREVEFVRAPASAYPDVIHHDSRLSYRQFLAGPSMADLHRLGEVISNTMERPPGFVETVATRLEDGEPADRNGRHATELIGERASEDLPFLSTRVVLVQGEAGSGKTIALRALTVRQANAYVEGKTDRLFFYVDAQGRALSRLEDAMAKDLQDLRSRFTYSAIAPLTRRELLVPIIDGFDELLGSGGYDEAFSSLAAFLSTLSGQGAVIASARSAFFSYRNFYENARRYSKGGRMNYEVDVVDVRPWSMDQIDSYVRETAKSIGKSTEETLHRFHAVVDDLTPLDAELLEKPFYTAKVTELVLAGESLGSEESLIDQLVSSFIQREHEKLLDKEGAPLLNEKGHHEFLAHLAEEMWWQESRRLDVPTVQTVAEIITEKYNLPPGAAQQIVNRVSSYAFLTADHSERRFLRFEHEVLYGYFLARKLQRCIESEPSDLRRFLNRSVLDHTLAEQAVRLLGDDVGRASRAVDTICDVVRSTVTDVVARSNGGMLVGTLLRSVGEFRDGIVIRTLVFRQTDFGRARLKEPEFRGCDFEQVDWSDLKLAKPHFEGCSFRALTVDITNTSLKGADPKILDQVFSIRVVAGDRDVGTGQHFAPEDIRAILVKLGVKGLERDRGRGRTGAQESRIQLIDRFARKMERRFYASDDDLAGFGFTRDEDWEDIFKLLQKHELVVQEYVQKAGPREPLYRLSVPPEVLRQGENVTDMSLPSEVRAFWNEVLSA